MHIKNFPSGPKIIVDFHLLEEKIHKTTLQLGKKALTCRIFNASHETSKLEEQIFDWLETYLLKRQPSFELPMQSRQLPPFTTEVLAKLAAIPFAQTLSYQEVASLAGQPRAARAVGNACHRNPFPLIIPCHRVIHQGGKLGGFAFCKQIKEELLDFEAGIN